MNKQTVALTEESYQLIINTIRSGFTAKDGTTCKPNIRIATALVLEANLGLRIGDVLLLHACDIIKDGSRYRLDITETKTGKQRTFTVPNEIYNYILQYALDNGISSRAKLFDISERAIQKHLKLLCEALNLDNIGTHSFRKYFATSIYTDNGYNIELVRQLLQHSSTSITQRYLGIQPKEVEDALQKHIHLI
jgi:integrase